jgi:GntR family transcriptional regulator, transcriptional repressor for pyruvate dehydrogenase complex
LSTTPMRPFPALKKTSVSLQAADAIKALIVSGDLGSGDALPAERDLAVRLGISRPSVREAIRVLTAMNVVEPRHGGGTYVTSLDPRLLARPINFLLQIEPRTFLHLFEVRQVLEVAAARLAAPKMTDELVAELQELSDAAAAALRSPARYSELDFELHTKIIEATGNPIYLSLYESIADLLLESRRRTVRTPGVRHQAHDDHRAIVAALRDRDPEGAARAMQKHLEGMRKVLDDMLAREEQG